MRHQKSHNELAITASGSVPTALASESQVAGEEYRSASKSLAPPALQQSTVPMKRSASRSPAPGSEQRGELEHDATLQVWLEDLDTKIRGQAAHLETLEAYIMQTHGDRHAIDELKSGQADFHRVLASIKSSIQDVTLLAKKTDNRLQDTIASLQELVLAALKPEIRMLEHTTVHRVRDAETNTQMVRHEQKKLAEEVNWLEQQVKNAKSITETIRQKEKELTDKLNLLEQTVTGGSALRSIETRPLPNVNDL